MNVLVINPGSERNDARRIPLGIAYLKSGIRFLKPECRVDIIDGLYEEPYESFLSRIKEFTPDVIGITVLTGRFPYALSLCMSIREALPEVFLIAGGLHAWLFPEELLEGYVDAVLVGESERLFPEVLDALQRGVPLTGMRGVLTSEDVKRRRPRKPQRVENLDALPFPLRGGNGYHPLYGVTTSLSTTRGCPYGCIFCAFPAMYGSTIRFRQVKNVIAEVAYCKRKLDVDTIFFTDACFTLPPQRTISLCKELLSQGLDLQWICQTRPDLLIHPEDTITEMLSLMKEAGCREIALGIESGSETVLDAMRKPHSREEVRTAVRRVQEARIDVCGLFVLGCIGETPDTLKETVEFAKSLDLEKVYFGVAEPYPGTELYTIAVQRGYLASPRYWMEPSLRDKHAVLDLPELPAERAVALLQWAYRSYHGTPRHIRRKLRRIIQKPDKRALKAALYGSKDILRYALQNLRCSLPSR